MFSDIGGAVGSGLWRKETFIQEKREVRSRELRYVRGSGWSVSVSDPRTETRSRYETERTTSTAYRIDTSGGGAMESGNVWWTIHPWTGQTIRGTM